MKYFIIYVCFYSVFWTGCSLKEEAASKSGNKLLSWIKLEEESINIELTNRIAQDQLNNPFDTTWVQKGFIVTEKDPTVLGELARRVKKNNNCCFVEYLFTPVLSERKIIRIGQELSDSCKSSAEGLKSYSDTTKYFIIENLLE